MSVDDSLCTHFGSSLRLVRLIIAMFHAHVEWPSLRPLHLIHFPSLHIFSFLNFLLPFTFLFFDVVDNNHAHCRWGPWHPGRERASHRLWAQRPLHYRGLCRVHQVSVTEQRFPEDFDYDDITIGQTLLNACRRRADHSEGEGLSSVCRCRRPWVMIDRGNPLFAVTQVTRKVWKRTY